MKKILSLCCATVLLFGMLFTAFPLYASSADRVYSATEVFASFGHHPSEADEYFFRDGAWTLEYYDTAAGTFAPMGFYARTEQSGWTVTWSNFYTVSSASLQSQLPTTYCCISGQGQMHPGAGAAAVLTFVAPVDGVLSYETVLRAYGSANTQAYQPETYGTTLSLRVNDRIVWPADGTEKVLTNDLGDVSLAAEGISVKQGDRVRLVVGARKGEHKNKGINFSSYPLVTYQSESLSSAVAGAPSVYYHAETSPGKGRLSWTPVKNAVGYHVSVDGKRINEQPIRALSYSLPSETVAKAVVTAVALDGTESAPSALPQLLNKSETVPSSSEGICYRNGTTMYTQKGSYSLLPPEPEPKPEPKPEPQPEPPAATEPALPVQTGAVTEDLQGGAEVDRNSDGVAVSPTDASTASVASPVPKGNDTLWIGLGVGGLVLICAGVAVAVFLVRRKNST